MRLTLKAINAELTALGDVQLVRGKGYYYFIGSLVASAYSTSVMVNTLNQLSLDQWLAEARRIIREGAKHHE